MRLPRRVPYASLAELDKLCSWIYGEEANDHSKQLAVSRLAAWRVCSGLPHALESTWLILSALLHDAYLGTQPSSSLSYVHLRQSYALSVVRLVNGLVDPLQQGTYARSISSIANQIGLPAWLVEMRHAATHEELPSLEVLREAARQSMAWLLHNYFLPTLSPHSSSSMQATDIPEPVLPPLAPLLKEYKELQKQMARDESLKVHAKADLLRILRNLERWIGEVKVALRVRIGLLDSGGAQGGSVDGEDAEEERAAMEVLCEKLIERRGLVPLAKKKRLPTAFHSEELPPDTPSNLSIWLSLLSHTQSNHSAFYPALLSQILMKLTSDDESRNQEVDDDDEVTYHACLASWALWLVKTGAKGEEGCRAEEALGWILNETGRSEGPTVVKRVTPLVKALTAEIGDEALKTKVNGLVGAKLAFETTTSATRISASMPQGDASATDTLDVMEQRLALLQARLQAQRKPSPDPSNESADNTDVEMEDGEESEEEAVQAVATIPGIRLLTRDRWAPCPIGMDGTLQ